MTIDINGYQLISINRLILIIDDQSMVKICVVIDWYRLSIPIDKLIHHFTVVRSVTWPLHGSEAGVDLV